ncbi:MAG: hypothetical protein SGI89_10030 [bacterium]|nr:hypothetical protein [bacterium]
MGSIDKLRIEVLPVALTAFENSELSTAPVIHFSLSLFHDGRLVLFDYFPENAACKTTEKYKNLISKQVDFCYRTGWEIATKNGCCCRSFDLLYDEDLPNDWASRLQVWEALGRQHILRPASIC